MTRYMPDYTNIEKVVNNIKSDSCDVSINSKGIALESGNSIPNHVHVEDYLDMLKHVNESRGVAL